MKKIPLALIGGTFLGLIDGVSSIFNPDAQEMLITIIISATIKGSLTGLFIGLISRRLMGKVALTIAGAIVGLLLSIIAAIPSGYLLEIIIPGVGVGFITGFLVAKWGK